MAAIEINPAHKNMLHDAMHVKAGQKINIGDLMKTKVKAKKAGNTKLEKEAVFAENAKGWQH